MAIKRRSHIGCISDLDVPRKLSGREISRSSASAFPHNQVWFLRVRKFRPARVLTLPYGVPVQFLTRRGGIL